MIDKGSSVPYYLQLKRMLELQVISGTLPPHSRIPSERELSEQYKISRMTARRALLVPIRSAACEPSRKSGAADTSTSLGVSRMGTATIDRPGVSTVGRSL